VENPEIVLVGVLGVAAAQGVVGLAQQERPDERGVVAVLGKSARLADQRVDQMALRNVLLGLPAPARQRLQAVGT